MCGPFGRFHVGYYGPMQRPMEYDHRSEPSNMQHHQHVSGTLNQDESALGILQKRYVKGEISEEEYQKMKRVLIEQ
ncbi:SHOCT domain-containing protein [Tepidibacillus fermentans]|uniref:Putative oligomerization/nucleic acid binding protein n=1 Tax=Tepidibacillus fermentans TaxID=1281767 RepID=A0A4R3KL18_9BACI|nr:SHOCT domain-containing protein [Tepidibacillus fermentans]TCS84593.1 putative oligomerization/nucleic acid binding protein [Tepidibacillus fermentans]